MIDSAPAPLRVAVLDLNAGEPNLGLQAILNLLAAHHRRYDGLRFDIVPYEVRQRGELPGLDFDLCVSSGGPGSPYDGEGSAWEADYFRWIEQVQAHNAAGVGAPKHVLFICHSYQLMVRFFELAAVTPRKRESFGIFPVHLTPAGVRDPLFHDLASPFYAADFRKWQVVRPDRARLAALGAEILCREKKRPHVPLERAVMGIRISPELVGVQFHPEADPPGMRYHFQKPERRDPIVKAYGEDRYERLLHRITAPGYLAPTHQSVLPNFIEAALRAIRPEVLASPLVGG